MGQTNDATVPPSIAMVFRRPGDPASGAFRQLAHRNATTL